MLKGGGGGAANSFEVVLPQELEVLAILKRGQQISRIGGGGGCERFYPVLRSG